MHRAVVPPACVKELFHRPGGEVFQRAGQHRARKEHRGRAALRLSHHEDNGKRAKTVDRADGAVEKTAVDQLSAGN